MRGRYPWSALAPDFLRGGAGVAISAAPLATLPLTPLMAAVLMGLTGLFLLFVLDTARRSVTRLSADDLGLTREAGWGRTRRLLWRDLSVIKVRYFSTRRDRQQGWMTVRLGDGRTTLHLDSTLEPFDPILKRAVAAAVTNGLVLDDVTWDNLAALGQAPPLPPQP